MKCSLTFAAAIHSDPNGLIVALNLVWIEARIMTFRPALLATIVIAFLSSAAYAQTTLAPQAPDSADFKVQVFGVAAADFDARMLIYAELRANLQQGLPALRLTDDPREILKAEHALAKRIRAVRAGAHGGEIFTSEIASAFKHALALETRPSTCASILDDNPGAFPIRSTILIRSGGPSRPYRRESSCCCPRLPADVEYRFLGQHLILRDTRANVILDRILDAIDCPETSMIDVA